MVKCWPCCSSQNKVRSPVNEEVTHSLPPPSIPNTSSPTPFSESMKPIIQQLELLHPTEQIDQLIDSIDYLLQKIKASPGEESSSSIPLDSVVSNTRLGADVIDKISTQVENSKEVFAEMGNLALNGVKMVGEAHWVFLGLSVAAYALERCVTVRSNVSECMELLQKISLLAKDLKQFNELMPGESDRLGKAVQIVLEGAIMCCSYIGKGKISRYWSAAAAKDQLEKTKQSIIDIRASLDSAVGLQTLRQNTFRYDQSPFELLDFKPVGIQEKVEKVMELLDMEGSEPALAVVLCGFGGVGKSTLAASAIQSLNWSKLRANPDFKYCRVKINYETPDIESHINVLQQNIITAFGDRKIKVESSEEGRTKLQKVMENKFCFLYIDNVVDKEHLGRLLPKDLLWFTKSNMSKENSEEQKTKLRILVTSREKNLKPKFNINCKEYEVHAFPDKAAELLLRETILQSQGQFSLDFDERSLITSVARACRGVPLILSVFGNHLRAEREERSYREALEALRQGNLDSFTDEDISGKLFFVYDKIRDEEEKDAFLDICKYFYGWEWNLVGNIVDPSRLESLYRRMLINKSDSGEVIVHDILRLMGEKKAEQTRISNYEEFSEVFEDGEGKLKTNKDVKGISLGSEKLLRTIESRHLDAVCQSLRVLMLRDWVMIDGLPCKKAFKNLRYLSVGDLNDFPFEDAFKLQKLTVFINSSKGGMNLHRLPRSLKVISHEVADPDCRSFEILPLQSLSSLENFMVKGRKSVKLPEELHLPSSLENLQFNCCSQLPKEFINLTALERLSMDNCDLESLPQGFGKLKKLKYLSVQHCTNLTSLPGELGLLSSMISLRLNGCTLLEKLPVDLGELSAIEELSMGECRNLRELPQGFGGLSSLHKLDLTGCISLQRLPESFGKLPIQSLNLQSLTNLDELPESTGNMPCLTQLKLISCNALTTLPNSFVQLSCLETLEIEDCHKLVALPRDFGQLSSLKEMTVRRCSKLEELPDGFQALPALMTFTLIDCRCLLNLPAGFGELVCLENLWLRGLPISNLPDGFGKLKRLEMLDLRFCRNIERLPDDFGSLASLTLLCFRSCTNLDGREMEKIVKLKLCYLVVIGKSPKLIERWEEMREQEEYPLVVLGGSSDIEEECRAAKVGLLGARCIELDSATQQLVERSTSILFEVDTIVAVIALPVHLEDHHHRLTERLVGMAMEKAKTGSAGRLRIVYVKQVKRKGETTEKEEQEEKACFRHILMSAPKGSYAIPSNDSRCHRLITFTLFRRRLFDAKKLVCRMLKMRVDYKGNKILELSDFIGEDDISGQSLHSSDVQDDIAGDEENENSNSIGEFIECICAGKLPGTAELSQSPPKESMFTEFLQILKKNKADHLIDSKRNKVELDQLKGNVVGIFICDQNTPEYTKLQQIYKEVRDKGLNFEVLWIPPEKFHGIGIYTRALQKMIWKALPNPNLVKLENTDPHFIIFDEEGSIGNLHALSPMMIWGAEAYPFSKSKINEIVSTIQSKFSLNFLFHKINLDLADVNPRFGKALAKNLKKIKIRLAGVKNIKFAGKIGW
ncbi:hypothetical protein SUGI_1148590 [Cryptomeria japonica]|nr:hypothetical protein SUGI_1148590 [Cryptomeria japonica]